MKKRILSLLLALVMIVSLLPTVALAEDAETPTSGACGDNATWTYDAATKTLTISGTGATYNYSSTVKLNNLAPYSDNSIYPIEHFVVSEGITKLGEYTIASYIISGTSTKVNNTVKDVKLPDSLTEVARYTFSKNAALKSITFPKNMTSFPTEANVFNACNALEEIEFEGNVTELGRVYGGLPALKSATIPEGTKELPKYAFSGCKNLTEITIPASVEKIGEKAFSGCSGLTKVTIPESVKEIGDYAFNACSSLTEVTIPESVEKLGSSAFAGCTSIGNITIPESVNNIGNKAFDKWTETQTINFKLSELEVKNHVALGNSWNANATVEYKQKDVSYCEGLSIALKDGDKSYTGTLDVNKCSITFDEEVDMLQDMSFSNPEIVVTKDDQPWAGTTTLSGPLTFASAGNGLYTTDTKLTLTPNNGDSIRLSMSFRVTEKAFEFQGSGTEADPYIVDSVIALYQLGKKVNGGETYSGKYFLQAEDIDMTGVTTWQPIGLIVNNGVRRKFDATYDGGNHKIKNWTVDCSKLDDDRYFGLFGNVTVLKNLTLDESCSFALRSWSGTLAYRVTQMENCASYATVTARTTGGDNANASIGGLAKLAVTMKDCANYGNMTITGGGTVGGLAVDCYHAVNCYNYGTVTATGTEVGGLFSSLSALGNTADNERGVISGCGNYGAVTGGTNVGGLVGESGGILEDCYNVGAVTATTDGAVVGGLAGIVDNVDSYTTKLGVFNSYHAGSVAYNAGDDSALAGHLIGKTQGIGKTADCLGSLYYQEIGLLPAIGNYDAGSAATGMTLAEMKSADFVNTLNQYKNISLSGAEWAADTAGKNNGLPVIASTEALKNYENKILALTLNGQNAIPGENHTFSCRTLPYGTDLTQVAMTAEISARAAMSPASGTTLDFSNGPVTLTVTAEDGTVQTYVVTASAAATASGLTALRVSVNSCSSIEELYGNSTYRGQLLLDPDDFHPEQTNYTFDRYDAQIQGNRLSIGKYAYFWAIPAEPGAVMTAKIGTLTGNIPASTDMMADGSARIRYWDSTTRTSLMTYGQNTMTLTVTPPEGGAGTEVTYTFQIDMRPSLKSVTFQEQGVEPSAEFAYDVLEYDLSVPESVTSLTPTAAASMSDFKGTISFDPALDENGKLDITNLSSFTVTASAGEGENLRTTVYTYHLRKVQSYAMQVESNAEKTQLRVYDKNGVQISAVNGTYSLVSGQTYTYIAAAKGYKSQTGTITGPESLTDGKLVLTLEAVAPSTLKKLDALWPSFRGNDRHMAITASETARTANEAELLWSTAAGVGYDTGAVSSPIIVDGYLYAYAGEKLLKVDMEKGNVAASGTMAGTSDFAIVPPTYAEGMIFVGLSKGRVQAFNAETLESLWVYSDPLKGQSNSPIVYHDGCVYTGFWNGETRTANYVCLSIDDEDPNAQTEAKQALWTYTQAGGFYWAGAYASGDYIVVGTDDGKSGYTSSTASLLVFDKDTGALADSKTGYTGDIRSNVSYDAESDRVYFTSKGGYFYSEKIDWTTGKIDTNESKAIDLGGMSTSTPVVYKGRAYVGVSGTSQFGPYSGHHIAVLDLTNWNVAYTATTQGYPQTSGMLTTAYEKDDGYVYVYFMDNYTPGVMRVIQDKAGQTALLGGVTESGHENCAPVVFTPEGKLAQYCICSPIADENGTIYFKNDTGYLMAIGNKTVSAAAVAAVEEKINAIGTVTLESEDAIKAAREAYDALTDAQKEKVTNYQTLLDAESALVELKADYAAAAAVDALIDKIGTVTLDSEADIAAARTAYDALTEKQKGYVTKLDVLTAAETELQNLKDAAAAKRVEDQINALPDTLTLDDKAAVDAAKAAYDALTEKQRGYISDSAKQKLNAALAEIKRLEDDKAAAEAVERLINAIGDVTLESEDAIKAAREAYDALTDAQKAFVSNYDVLVAAEARYAQLVDEAAAEHVIDLINGIGKVNKNSGTAIKAARDAYDALTPAQKKLVSNYQTLLDAEKRYEELTTPVNPVGPSKPSKPATPDTGKNLPFTDVAKRDWYYDGVKYAYDNGLMNGTGANAFSPNADTTRGMIVTILARLEGVNTSGGAVWYEAGREWAMKNGISDGTNMEGKITREQLAAMLYRYAKMKGYDVSASASLSGYTDASSVSGWAKEAMQWAVGSGLIQGSGNALTPQANASRAQIATILMRFAEKIAK